MNLVDIIIVVFILLWMVRGYFVGFSLTIATLAGMIGGIAAAIFFSPSLADMMRNMIENDMVRVLVAYFLIFFIVSTIFRILGFLLRDLLKKWKMTDLDAMLGSAVSSIEAVLIIMIVLLLISQTPWEGARRQISASTLGPVFLKGAKLVVFNMPDEVREKLEQYTREAPADPLPQPGSPEPERTEDEHNII